MKAVTRRDKLLTKFKKSRSHSDNENYKKSRNKVQRMIKNKKKNFVIRKLNDNIGKPKELWKSLKSLGLPSKTNSSATICLEKDGILSFDPKTNAEIFKDFYSNLANNLVKKLPTPPNKYGKTAVNNYYKKLNLRGKNFSFAPVAPATILKLLKQLNPAKSAGIDNLTAKFLKEGAPVLASPITDLVNLSILLSLFPDDCKIAKLKPLYKKEAKTKPKNYRPISLLPLLSKIIERICSALIQPHFDYACVAWYPLLNKRQSKRIQIAQKSLLCNALIQPHFDYACVACIRYCLNLDNKAHIGTNEFLKINWLPTKKRVEQCICANVFKFFNQMSPQYTAEIFHPSSSVHNTRRATQKLDLPFRKSCIGQKTLSYIGPKIWNNLPAQIKPSKSVNTFKHDN